MTRMKWSTHPDLQFIQRFGCGRFEVGGHIFTPSGGSYARLYDSKTNTEYPCRTLASAKTAARNILIQEGDKQCL